MTSVSGWRVALLWALCGGVMAQGGQAQGQTPPSAAAPGAPAPGASGPSASGPGASAPANRTFLYQGEATSILGRQVHDPAGALVGRIVDVLVGDGGVPRAAVIDFGGFMGVGNRRVAVSWTVLRFDPVARTINLDMTVDQIRAIPQFRQPVKPADPPVSVALPPPTPMPTPSPAPSPAPGPAPAPEAPGAGAAPSPPPRP